MFVNIESIAFDGLETIKVDVEISISSRGLPCFDIVGLPAKTIAESKHRIKMSFINQGLEFPSQKRVVVNLAPADIEKKGSFYDLPIAMGIMCIQYGLQIPNKSMFFGEISMDGHLRYVSGAFLLSLYAKKNGYDSVFVPNECVEESRCISNVKVFGVSDLMKLYYHLKRQNAIKYDIKDEKYFDKNEKPSVASQDRVSIDNVIKQDNAKRALEISAAGRHNLLMTGPPGSGKSLLAKSLKYLLPDLDEEESIEVSSIYSYAGKMNREKFIMKERPFRSPHHTISYAGMVGGGSIPSPGEITLSHKGVLFLDEINEFSRSVLETLRQPLEDDYISIARSRKSYIFPASFILVGACNPCPCGYYGDETHKCKCTEHTIEKYKNKLSGPFLDRIDLNIYLQRVDVSQLDLFEEGSKKNYQRTEKEIKKRVIEANYIQRDRYQNYRIKSNSRMNNQQVKKFCILSASGKILLENAVNRYALSMRSYFRILKVGRTIADLDNSADISDAHIAEAVHYRTRLG